jgi:hypothetical protein
MTTITVVVRVLGDDNMMLEAMTADRQLATEGSDLPSFMSRNAPSANCIQNGRPFMKRIKKNLFETVTMSISKIPFQLADVTLRHKHEVQNIIISNSM